KIPFQRWSSTVARVWKVTHCARYATLCTRPARECYLRAAASTPVGGNHAEFLQDPAPLRNCHCFRWHCCTRRGKSREAARADDLSAARNLFKYNVAVTQG